MPVPLARLDLRTALVQHSETIFRKRLSVLFRRGDPALGLFVVRSGSVNLDFGSGFAFDAGLRSRRFIGSSFSVDSETLLHDGDRCPGLRACLL